MLYYGGFDELAVWLLKADDAKSTPSTTARHTVRGVAVCYEYLTEASGCQRSPHTLR
jgi:hypothetical protein